MLKHFKLREGINSHSETHLLHGVCPRCGYCPHCGRSGHKSNYWNLPDCNEFWRYTAPPYYSGLE